MKPAAANDTAFAWFEGSWMLTRKISTGLAASGRADLRLVESGLLDYLEQGALLSGEMFTKRYRFELTGAGIIVTHNDTHNRGEPFQTLQFEPVDGADWTGVEAIGHNVCGDDTYSSTYRVSEDRLSVVHEVTGPRKDYRIDTAFKRLANG